ncbi:MAG: hypothetical protein GX115_01970 [Ruminiclostridium sp.]|nr:hypothetical protein [Ruminiclostridium sp.]
MNVSFAGGYKACVGEYRLSESGGYPMPLAVAIIKNPPFPENHQGREELPAVPPTLIGLANSLCAQ